MTFRDHPAAPELDWSIGSTEIYWDPVPWIPRLENQRAPVGWLIWNADTVFHHVGKWEERTWLNVPGPIYAGQTDNCGVGPATSPRHFLHGGDDGCGGEFLYRQPKSLGELRDVVAGADQDPWLGWACDGDDHWTPRQVRHWWRSRGRIERWIEDQLRNSSTSGNVVDDLAEYRTYLRGDLESDLRAYCFWLEERRSPTPHEPLPAL